jgi:Rrf2 family cysteine metabolism transcriptional repressor
VVLSQKSQYAVRAVFELAKRQGTGLVAAARIGEAEYIPVRFLENILGQLRQAGIVESVRGKEGGYRLSRPPHQVTVGEVVRLIQGPMSTVDCAEAGNGAQASGGRSCPLHQGCVLLPIWGRAQQAMMDVFDGTTFKDLVEQERAANERAIIDYVI